MHRAIMIALKDCFSGLADPSVTGFFIQALGGHNQGFRDAMVRQSGVATFGGWLLVQLRQSLKKTLPGYVQENPMPTEYLRVRSAFKP